MIKLIRDILSLCIIWKHVGYTQNSDKEKKTFGTMLHHLQAEQSTDGRAGVRNDPSKIKYRICISVVM